MLIETQENQNPDHLNVIFLSQGKNVKGYRLWDKEEMGFRVIIRKYVIFNEPLMIGLKGKAENLKRMFKLKWRHLT